jgi:hypothetical protein
MLAAEVEGLLPYCTTDRQREVLNACRDVTMKVAAADAGLSERKLFETVRLIKQRATLQGFNPEHGLNHPVPAPLELTGTSQYHSTDKIWIKTKVSDLLKRQMFEDAACAMAETLPRLKPVPAPKFSSPDFVNVYTFTDCHVGGLVRADQCGEDWNLEIAESVLTGCLDEMLRRSVKADDGILVIQGDWLHQNGSKPFTPTSGHLLDAEGFAPTVRACIRILRRMVQRMLARHHNVRIIICEGNHDIDPSVWLREMFAAWLDDEPRATVEQSEHPYYVAQYGEVMLAWHHGHLKKNQELPLYFAAYFPTIWGSTRFRYVNTGHMHHRQVHEHAGIELQQHPTITAPDSHSSRHAYLSHRVAIATTYHRRHGRYNEYFVTPGMLEYKP